MVTLLFIVLLYISSFLVLVAVRFPKKESIFSTPLHCTHCKHPLSFFDLIPVVSYFLLKGKCQYCRNTLSPIYPLSEVLMTLLLFFSFLKTGLTQELFVVLPLVALLCMITMSDVLYKVIPNKINLLGLIYFLFLHLMIYSPYPFITYLWGIAAGGGLLLLIAFVSRGGMGGGDIKLMAVIGIAIGWKLTLLALFLASLIGGGIGMALLLLKLVTRKEPVPFGPFLALGTLIAYFWGDNMIHAYITYFIGG